MPSSVSQTHSDYDKVSPRWKLCRAAVAGQSAVRELGKEILPPLKDQTPDDYKAYLTRAVFTNFTWRTVSALSGMIARKPPVVEVAESVKPLLEDVTGTGVSFQILAQQVTIEDLTTGRLGILVDYPAQSTAGLTLADTEKLGLRPTMQLYKAEPFYNWKKGRVNNKTVPVEIRLSEDFNYPPEGFENPKTETRYRVLDLVKREGAEEEEGLVYRVRVFRINDKNEDEQVGEDLFPLMNGKPLDFIPFFPIGIDDTTLDLDEPPLIDLVDLNIAHFRMDADYRHGLHYTALPTAFIAGYRPENENDKMYIGSTTVNCIADPQAKAFFLEFTGQGLSGLEKALSHMEEQMAIIGARLLTAEKKATETSQTAAIHKSGENSILSSISGTISDGLTKALRVFSEWAGSPGEWSIELNREFMPPEMTPQELTALVSAWQMGAISMQVLFDQLQKKEVIASDLTLEEMQAQIGSEGPHMPGMGVEEV